MEFRHVVRKRKMIRTFTSRRIRTDLLDRVLETALHAPSAGFAQGLELVVLEEPSDIAEFWRITDPRSRKHKTTEEDPDVIVIPFSDKLTYLERYSQPDKQGLGMDVEEGWPVPYWDLDAAMAVMLMLLAAVDEGLGAWYFGIFHGTDELMSWLGVPEHSRPIGAVGLGYPHPDHQSGGSALSRDRRSFDDVVHRDRW